MLELAFEPLSPLPLDLGVYAVRLKLNAKLKSNSSLSSQWHSAKVY